MNSTELKSALQQQSSTFVEDIQKKMTYLQGTNDLGADYYQYSDIQQTYCTSSLEDIMTSSLLKTPSSKDEDYKKSEDNKKDSSVFLVKEYDFEKRRDKIMARINALKGKSLPGAYLQSSSR